MIELKNFSCFYSKNKIVQNCTLNLYNGELTALLGPNGCGKSTLIKGICQCTDTSGECLTDGKKLSHDPKMLAEHLTYIPQRCGINIALSVLDVVLMGANSRTSLLADYSQKERESAKLVLQKFIAIDPAANFLTLSEGQKQLVILARAFFQNAGNMLLDEPDSALDFNNKHMVIRKIKELTRENICILLSLHDPSLALRYCDRLLFMKNGEIIGDQYTANANTKVMEALFEQLYPGIRLIEHEGRLIPDKR